MAIVRSLIMHPKVLLLDEITAALDPEMVREVLQVVLQLHLSERAVEIGIIILYVVSVFTAGFIVGKLMKTRKFLWGMVEGLAYYLILFVLSMIMQKNLAMDGRELLTVFCICMGGGMLGGMLS